MAIQGYVKIHRTILNHWIWQIKPFSKGQAWIDLLLMANHDDNDIAIGNEILNVQRGAFVTSELKLMDRWGWSKSKVRAFLKLLEKEKMIIKSSDSKRTGITLCNYSVWQDLQTAKKPVTDRTKTASRLQKDTNKNVKNEKNEKNEKKEDKNSYAEFVKMTRIEFQKLVDTYGESQTNELIRILNNYKGANGKLYESDYLAILSWVVDKYMNQKARSIPTRAGGQSFEQREYTERDIEDLYFDPMKEVVHE